MNTNLIDQLKYSQAITVTAGAAGATAVNGATLDMAGYDGVIMEVQFGAIVTGAVTSIKAQQGAASNLSDAADLLGSGQTIADTDDEKLFLIDLYQPLKRYVRLVVSRATQNATVIANYIQYKGRALPVAAQGTNVSYEKFSSPAEGTA